jgi:hypothetical protein
MGESGRIEDMRVDKDRIWMNGVMGVDLREEVKE